MGRASGRSNRNYESWKKLFPRKKTRQGLPVATVLEGDVHGNSFYTWVLDWTDSFSQSRCWEGLGSSEELGQERLPDFTED